MKKHVIIATGLAVLSTSAYASKARMDALGQDATYGSFYIEDTRNVFRNAAHVNTHTNYMITEWGTGDSAEGGFFREHGAFNYGVYLGSNRNDQLGAAGYANDFADNATNTDVLGRSNELDLFFGGDAGMQWGARLSYSKAKNEGSGEDHNDAERSSMGIGLGVTHGQLSGYLNLDLKDEAENTWDGNTTSVTDGRKWEADTSIQVGGSYDLGDMTIFAEYMTRGWEYTVDENDEEMNASEQTTITLGVGRIHEISSTARVYMDLAFIRTSNEDNDGSDEENVFETTYTRLPLTVGYEADATSWLTLRGSISQNILIGSTEFSPNTEGAADFKQTEMNSTSVNAGATLNFGNLMVDGMIGTTGNEDTISLGDNFLTQVAVHYWF